MRIGIDGSCWINRRGYGRFARELLAALVAQDRDNEYCFVVDFSPDQAPALPPGARWLRVHTSTPAAQAAAASGHRTLRDLWAMGWAMRRERFDLFFFPSVYSYFPIPGGGSKVVVAIHDVIAERYPEYVFPNRRAACFWKLKVLAARWQADLVLTVSEASKRGIMEEFGVPSERIQVIPEAANRQFRPMPPGEELRDVLARRRLLETRFLLYVGGISPHKNLHTLVEAVAHLHREPQFQDCKLVLVGDYQGDVFYSSYDDLQRLIRQLGLTDAVVFTGYVSDTELVYLYNAASVFVLPSLCEGFGLPALEAMACGTPVVAGANGSLPELIGEAGLLYDPQKPAELRRALQLVLSDQDLQARMRQQGLQRAAAFSWERSANQVREMLGQLVPQRGGVRKRDHAP